MKRAGWLALGLAVALWAQETVFRTGVSLVRVDAQVTDGTKGIDHLEKEDFLVKDNGVEQPILYCSQPRMPKEKQATFLDMYHFLADPDRADFIKSFVTDRALLHRWNHNFPHPKECAPTLTRITPFVRNASLRKLFECPEPQINIASIMNNRKILLVDLGGISESTKILATLL